MAHAIARTTGSGQDFWYAYLVRDVVLVEEVSSDGFHRFALADDKHLVDLVVEAALHPDSEDGVGEPILLRSDPSDPTPPDNLLERLGSAFVRADVVVRFVADSNPPLLGLFSGPSGCWLVDVATGTGDVPVARPKAVVDMRDDLARHISQARLEATIRGQ